jgi:hypothetical protein
MKSSWWFDGSMTNQFSVSLNFIRLYCCKLLHVKALKSHVINLGPCKVAHLHEKQVLPKGFFAQKLIVSNSPRNRKLHCAFCPELNPVSGSRAIFLCDGVRTPAEKEKSMYDLGESRSGWSTACHVGGQGSIPGPGQTYD